VRQPLAVNYIAVSSERERRSLESEVIKQMVLEELNVKELRFESQENVAAMATQPDYAADNIENASSVLYKNLTPELEAEGMAREIVHRLQTMRRSAGFNITDHIITYYRGDDYIRKVMSEAVTADYIKQETLSRELTEGLPEETDYKENYKLNSHEVLLGVKKQ